MSGFTESQNFAILPHELQLASLLHLTSLLDKKDQVHVVPAPGLQRQALEHLSHSKLDEVQTLDTLSHLCSLLSDDTTLVSRAGVLIEPPGRLQRHPSQGDPSDMQLDPPRIHTLQEAWTCGLDVFHHTRYAHHISIVASMIRDMISPGSNCRKSLWMRFHDYVCLAQLSRTSHVLSIAPRGWDTLIYSLRLMDDDINTPVPKIKSANQVVRDLREFTTLSHHYLDALDEDYRWTVADYSVILKTALQVIQSCIDVLENNQDTSDAAVIQAVQRFCGLCKMCDILTKSQEIYVFFQEWQSMLDQVEPWAMVQTQTPALSPPSSTSSSTSSLASTTVSDIPASPSPACKHADEIKTHSSIQVWQWLRSLSSVASSATRMANGKPNSLLDCAVRGALDGTFPVQITNSRTMITHVYKLHDAVQWLSQQGTTDFDIGHALQLFQNAWCKRSKSTNAPESFEVALRFQLEMSVADASESIHCDVLGMNRPCHPLAAAFFFASTDNSSKTAVTLVDSDLESSCYIPQHITSTVKDTVLHQIGSKLAAVCQQHSVEKKLADQVDASLRELLSTPSRPRTRTESAAAMFRHAASEIYKPFWLRNPFLK